MTAGTPAPAGPLPPPDIYVAGLGIVGVRQLTREVEDAVRASQAVFLVDAGYGVAPYLRTLCGRVESLLPEYTEGGLRTDTYEAMAAKVIDAALENGPVTYAVYGHPMFFVYPSTLIRRAAALLGLVVEVLPGVSAIDTAMIDLGLDVGMTGLQLHEATAAMLVRRQLDPTVPCMLLQVDAIETALYTAARSVPARFAGLQNYLLERYPADHQVTAIKSSSYPLFGPVIDTFPIVDLPERLAVSPALGTLFIPAVGQAAVVDHDLAAAVNSADHLRDITSQDS